MRIAVMEIIRYPPGLPWNANEWPDPGWHDIEVAIRRLDRDEWPFLWLHTRPPVDGEMPDQALCIMGGDGEYNIFLSTRDREIHIHDDSRPDDLVHVWKSDQGAWLKMKELCNDTKAVLSIARHFTETAELHPDFRWRDW